MSRLGTLVAKQLRGSAERTQVHLHTLVQLAEIHLVATLIDQAQRCLPELVADARDDG